MPLQNTNNQHYKTQKNCLDSRLMKDLLKTNERFCSIISKTLVSKQPHLFIYVLAFMRLLHIKYTNCKPFTLESNLDMARIYTKLSIISLKIGTRPNAI